MPDVIVWLLNNKKRISYCRIPSQTIIYSDEGWTGGRMSGKLQTLHLKVYHICLIIGLIIIDAANIDTKDQ